MTCNTKIKAHGSAYLSLQGNSTLRVGDLDTELLSLSDNLNSVSGRNIVSNLSSVRLSVHQQNIQVLDIVDNKNLVAGWDHMSGLLVRTVTNLWHRDGAPESSSDTGVNTLRLSPALADTHKSVRLVSLELLVMLLDNLGSWNRGSHCLC